MRSEPTTSELQALATRQQQQLDTQARLIAARENRLRQVQEGVQAASDASSSSEAERVRKLRERVEAQEAKLRKLRALRGQVDQQRITNGSLSADLTSIRALFNEKEKELSMAAAQVEELTRQLEQFGTQAHHAQAHPGSKAYFVQLHLERLRAELMYRNKVNEQKAADLKEKKARLLENRENVGDMEIRINELRERLQRKKMLNQQLANQLSDASQKNNKVLSQQQQQQQQQRPTKNSVSQVAAIEPFNRQQQPQQSNVSDQRDDDVTDFSKNDPKYQTLPYNTRFLPMNFHNNNNNNNNNKRGSPTMMKSLKVASVPPQVAEKPALPPKPAVNYKPLLPPRQNPDKDSSVDPSQPPSDEKGTDYLLAKAELPLKPKPLTLKKHVIPPPPPPLPPPPPSQPPEFLAELTKDEAMDAEDERDDESSHPQIEQAEDRVGATYSDQSGESPMASAHPLSAPNYDEDSAVDKGAASLMTEARDPSPPLEGVARRLRKGNLKSGTADALRKSRRVSFDPLALLLDASLEGELELVKKTALEVSNPSAANDEGITALHNAICAGHLEIVRFLVELGCDVNAQDSDGWTPLHCAASCNNLAMVKFLVEHGACIFAATLSDQETAAEKCEEDEEGFDGCSEYLYSIQEKLGILNGGRVSAVYDYEAQNSDELTFRMGDELVVLRKGDDYEREWWWSRLSDHEGYVPRNLLGLYPRMKRKESEE